MPDKMSEQTNTLMLSANQLTRTDNFPERYLCELNSESIIEISGEDTQKYLQGQLTANLNQLNQTQGLRTCHCDAKGKTLHIALMAQWQTSVLLIGHSASSNLSLSALKKFGVFSNLSIEDRSSSLRVFAGKGAEVQAWLQQVFGQAPAQSMACVQSTEGGALAIDHQSRFIIWLSPVGADSALHHYEGRLVDESIWYAEQVIAGIPSLCLETVEQFVPQMLNLQALDAISFTKGCYMGQETVARAKYLGKNKRATYLLKSNVAVAVKPNERLELALGENWKPTGNVINAATLAEQTWILAVLPNDLTVDDCLRYHDVEFKIQTLPYELASTN